jgi:hypothetical protein
MERTLGRAYNGPFVPCRISGWRRIWDAYIPNQTYYAQDGDGTFYPKGILYLNVRRDPATTLCGVAFVVTPEELAGFDEREVVYDRIAITEQLSGIFGGVPAYMYVCRPEHRRHDVRSPRDAAIRATYIQIVETGLSDLGTGFRDDYYTSSDPLPDHLVIQDRT